MLLKHEEMLGRTSLQPEDVQQLVVETMTAEKVVSHSQVSWNGLVSPLYSRPVRPQSSVTRCSVDRMIDSDRHKRLP